MKLSDNGKILLMQLEGKRLQSYQDSAGIWTIGYGNTYYEDGSKVKKGDVISEQRCKELLNLILPNYENGVSRNVKVILTQNQFDALVIFRYNTGGSETLFKMINTRESETNIYNWWISHYTMAGGKVLAGLVRRRKIEADLFIKK